MISPQLESRIRLALEDTARRSGRDPAKLRVVLAAPVTWSDGSMGCPQPGQFYTQALVPGYRIVIAADSETFEYHGASNGEPFYCPPERLRAPPSDSPGGFRS